jgi:hypothetical protein
VVEAAVETVIPEVLLEAAVVAALLPMVPLQMELQELQILAAVEEAHEQEHLVLEVQELLF